MKEMDKRNIVLLTIAFILVSVIGVAFAYFQNQIGDGASVDVHANADTVDSLVFIPGGDIEIKATQGNFASGLGNRTGETTLTAILKANSTTKQAHYTYNVYLDIFANDFIYTDKENMTPELVLLIKDPDGNYLSNVDGLIPTTINIDGKDINGFDITIKKGIIDIETNYKIDINEGDSLEKKQEWEIKVIFVNLDQNQYENAGKNFNAKVTIQSEKRNYVQLDTSTTYHSIEEYYREKICSPNESMKECKNKIEEDYNTFKKENCSLEVSEEECWYWFEYENYYSYNELGQTYRSEDYIGNIQNIKFVDYIDNNYTSSIKYWDLSTNKDESIIGWLKEKEEIKEECDPEYENCKLYELYIGSKEKMYINNFNSAFEGMWSLETIDFGEDVIDTSLVTDMSYMFSGTSITDLEPIRDWNTSNVTDMSMMFNYTPISDLEPISGWDTSNVTDMSKMFSSTSNLNSVGDITNWDTSNVMNMDYMFYNSGITTLDLSGWDVSNVTYMSGMFYKSGITTLDLSGWKTSNVTDMSTMFSETSSLIEIKGLENFKTSSVTDMGHMFENSGITTLDLSGWDTSSVTIMNYMFSNDSQLTNLNINNFSFNEQGNYSSMFSDPNSELKITTNQKAKDWLITHKEEIGLTIDNDLIIVPK